MTESFFREQEKNLSSCREVLCETVEEGVRISHLLRFGLPLVFSWSFRIFEYPVLGAITLFLYDMIQLDSTTPYEVVEKLARADGLRADMTHVDIHVKSRLKSWRGDIVDYSSVAEYPLLQSVGGNLEIAGAHKFDCGALEHVGGNLSMPHDSVIFTCNSLKYVGGFLNVLSAISFECKTLASVGGYLDA